jgi:aspartate/methionine/tyrosine aminotransferase
MNDLSQSHLTIHHSPIVEVARLAAQKKEVWGFHSGSPGHGCPEEVLRQLQNISIEHLSRYGTPHYGSDSGRLRAVEYFKARYNLTFCSKTQVNLSSGFTHFFKALTETIIDRDDPVLLIEPIFPQYLQPLHTCGAQVFTMSTTAKEQWKPSPQRLAEQLELRNYKLLIFNYPNNPSGATLTETDWNQILDVLMQHGRRNGFENLPIVLSDDAYAPLIHAPAKTDSLEPIPITLGQAVSRRLKHSDPENKTELYQLLKRIVFAASLSKEGVAGSLLGLSASSNEQLIQAIRVGLKATVINSNSLGELALQKIYDGQSENLKWAKKLYAQRLNDLADGLDVVFEKHGFNKPVDFRPQAGMYLYANFESLDVFKTHLQAALWLLEKANLAVVPMGAPDKVRLRFSVGLPQCLVTKNNMVLHSKTEESGKSLIDRTLESLDLALNHLPASHKFDSEGALQIGELTP